MPNPLRYKSKKNWMSDCMRITKLEGKSREQSIAQCLSQFKNKHQGKDSTDYSKYLEFSPNNGLEYYVLRIPKDATPPKVGDSLKLNGVDVIVHSVSTPDDICKGRGGPVADSLEKAGIGWDVNCLLEGHKWLKQAGYFSSLMVRIADDFQEDIDKAKEEGIPSVFLGGYLDDGNKWREEIKKEFKDDFLFIDPYDPDWDAEEDIYNELAAILNVDHVIFYKGGKGTEKEKEFSEDSDKDYKSFDSMNELKAYLKALSSRVAKKACISTYLRRIASRIMKSHHSYGMLGIQVPSSIANKIKEWSKENISNNEICPHDGRELDTHITVLYGFNFDDPKPLEDFLKSYKPFLVTLNKSSMFNNDPKNDVLKISVNSPALQRLHSDLRERFKTEKGFPEYHPHITVAYLKKGYIEKYLDKDFSDESFTVDILFFSDTKNKKTNIKLNG